jgi:hypothetical protein
MEGKVIQQHTYEQLRLSIEEALDVYLTGPSGCGKSYITSYVLNQLDIPHLVANCTIHDTLKQILNEIYNEYIVKELKIQLGKPGHIYNFINELNIYDAESSSTYYLVLDRVDKLIQNDPLSIYKLYKFRDLAHLNIKFVLISEIYEEGIHSNELGSDIPILISHIPMHPLIKEDLLAILLLNKSHEEGELIKFFMDVIVQNTSQLPMNIYTYRYILSRLTPIYTNLTNKHSNLASIRSALSEHFKSINQLLLQQHENSHLSLLKSTPSTKLLLISSFICSYNPSKSDSFMVKAVKTKDRKSRKSELRSELTEEPKSFSIRRLLCIYEILYNLLYGEDSNISVVKEQATLCATIRTMIEIGLLQQGLSKDNLGVSKLICNIPLSVAEKLSDSLNLKLNEYVIGLG